MNDMLMQYLSNPVIFIPIVTVGLAIIGAAGAFGRMASKVDHVEECIHRIEKQLHGRMSHLEERIARIEDKLDKVILELRSSK